MDQQPTINSCLISSFQFLAGVAATIVLLVSVPILIGWVVNSSAIVTNTYLYMKPNTATAFVLAAISFFLSFHRERDGRGYVRWLGIITSVLVFVLGVVTILEYLVGTQLSIDRIFVVAKIDSIATSDPWRMGATTAFGLVFLAIALLSLHAGAHRGGSAAQGISCVIFVIWIFGFLDHILNPAVSQLHMPVLTVLCLGLMAFALLLGRPDQGLMTVLIGENLGGSLARRLFPAAILLSLLIAWVRWKGEEFGYYDSELGVAVSTAFQIILLSVLILANARSLENADELRKRAEAVASRDRDRLRSRSQQQIDDLKRDNEKLQEELARIRAKSAAR